MRLQADRVTFSYRNSAPCLREITFGVDGGEIAFVLGANGSGKSTLLACLAGLRRPTSGAVFLDGAPLAVLSANERARRVGAVPQLIDPAFALRVEDAVLLGRAPYIGLFGRPSATDRRAADRALEDVGLASLRTRPVHSLSGGERQRVWIARGLAQGASCLLLDEPTAHLDPAHEGELFAAVQRLAASGSTFVVASHHPGWALVAADRVVLLHRGEQVASGSPAEALTSDALRAVYGIAFTVLTGPHGERAVVPSASDGGSLAASR